MAWVFWAEAIGFPCLAMFMNLALRKKARIPATGAADLLMLVVVFDAIALFRYRSIEVVVVESYRSSVVETFAFLLFGGLAVWVMTIIGVEPAIERGFNRRSGEYANFPLVSFLFAWTVAVALVAAHATVFLW